MYTILTNYESLVDSGLYLVLLYIYTSPDATTVLLG
jgi:hypothetical protein